MPNGYRTTFIKITDTRTFALNEYLAYAAIAVLISVVSFIVFLSLFSLIYKPEKPVDKNTEKLDKLRGGQIEELDFKEHIKLEKILRCL